MNKFFFNGSTYTKIDEKNRFVIPQSMRYGLIENGALSFTMGLSLGGALAIYKTSDMEKIIRAFKAKQHVAKYQKFFTLFFSTLHHLTCDKLGRVLLPPVLKKAVNIQSEIVICGVLNKIELWPREKYDRDLNALLDGDDENVSNRIEEAFALLEEGDKKEDPLAILSPNEATEYQEL